MESDQDFWESDWDSELDYSTDEESNYDENDDEVNQQSVQIIDLTESDDEIEEIPRTRQLQPAQQKFAEALSSMLMLLVANQNTTGAPKCQSSSSDRPPSRVDSAMGFEPVIGVKRRRSRSSSVSSVDEFSGNPRDKRPARSGEYCG